MGKIRILVVSNTPWDDSNSFGSSYSNIFGGNDNYEIANIYCRPGHPNTKVCTRFFQITEKSIVSNLFKKNKRVGVEVIPSTEEEVIQCSQAFEFGQRHRWRILYWIRNCVWGGGRWQSPSLDEYIDSFKPDIIFQPIYYSTYIGEIGLYAKKRMRVPIIGYISDDNYTLHQYSISPFYWIERLIVRRYVKRVIDSCSLLYTITPKQRDEYNAIFGNKCKVLTKGCEFKSATLPEYNLHSPIRLMYAGGLGNGRWKTLAKIAEGIASFNTDKCSAMLYVYSPTHLNKKQLSKLNIEGASTFCGAVTQEELRKIQEEMDVFVHVESFDMKERYTARLSFSTKITDYLQTGKCVLAVGWKETGAIELLKDNNAAWVITQEKFVKKDIVELLSNPIKIKEIGRNGYEFGKKQFNIYSIRDMLYKDILITISHES